MSQLQIQNYWGVRELSRRIKQSWAYRRLEEFVDSFERGKYPGNLDLSSIYRSFYYTLELNKRFPRKKSGYNCYAGDLFKSSYMLVSLDEELEDNPAEVFNEASRYLKRFPVSYIAFEDSNKRRFAIPLDSLLIATELHYINRTLQMYGGSLIYPESLSEYSDGRKVPEFTFNIKVGRVGWYGFTSTERIVQVRGIPFEYYNFKWTDLMNNTLSDSRIVRYHRMLIKINGKYMNVLGEYALFALMYVQSKYYDELKYYPLVPYVHPRAIKLIKTFEKIVRKDPKYRWSPHPGRNLFPILLHIWSKKTGKDLFTKYEYAIALDRIIAI